MEDRSAILVLASAMKNDRSAKVREWTAMSLGSLHAKEAVDELTATLRKDPDGKVRGRAAWALAVIDEDSALLHLKEALEEETHLEAKFQIAFEIAQREGRESEATKVLLEMRDNNELSTFQEIDLEMILKMFDIDEEKDEDDIDYIVRKLEEV